MEEREGERGTKVKIRPIYWIALALALALGVAVCDGLRIRNKESIVVGRYQEALRIADANDVILNQTIADAKKTITLQTEKIAELLGNAGKPTATEIAQDKIIAEQEKKIAGFKAQGDYKAALEQSQTENRAWSEKFTLAEERRKTELFDLNVAWTVKFSAQVTISESWKAKYDAKCRLLQLATQGWKIAENKLRRTRVMSDIKSALIVGTLGYFGYSTLKARAK